MDLNGYCVRVYAEAPQATEIEGLAQGPYVAASAGFEPSNERRRILMSHHAPEILIRYLVLFLVHYGQFYAATTSRICTLRCRTV